jgi:hypothetical protein
MKFYGYPDVVNQNAVRIVAGFVTALTIVAILIPSIPISLFLTYGFLARFIAGPSFDLFAFLASKVIVPKLNISFLPTAGVPKRFAQSIGLAFSLIGLAFLLFGNVFYYQVTLSILAFFALLESSLGFCAGCFAFSLLMKVGLIPEEVCERCNNLKLNA